MSIFNFNDPFGLILITLPLVTFILSITLQLLVKQKIIVLSGVFITYLILTFTVFNSSFLIWCFVYTGIALIGTLIADNVLHFAKRNKV